MMRFPMTKDGFARIVPIHDHLVAEGLLDYWRTAGPGYLFVSRSPAKVGASRSRQEMRASEIASWIQAQVSLADGVSPNHGWRHTFATNAEAAGIPKRTQHRHHRTQQDVGRIGWVRHPLDSPAGAGDGQVPSIPRSDRGDTVGPSCDSTSRCRGPRPRQLHGRARSRAVRTCPSRIEIGRGRRHASRGSALEPLAG